MKLPNFSSVALAMLGLLSTSLAADYADWVAKGYRWSAVNGPHAYKKKEDAKNERLHGGSSVSEVIGRAYYLRQGKVILIVGPKLFIEPGTKAIYPAFERERPRIVNNFAVERVARLRTVVLFRAMNSTRPSNLAMRLEKVNEYLDHDEF